MYIHRTEIPVYELETNRFWVIGDLHLDSVSFMKDAWKRALSLVKDDPVILLGDVIDYGFFDNWESQLERRVLGTEVLKEVWRALEDLNVVLLCEGNHDVRAMKRTGENFLEYLAWEKGFGYVRGQAVLRVKTGRKKRNLRDESYRFVFTHGSRGGRRYSSTAIELEDLAHSWSGVDAIFIGHHHRYVQEVVTKNVYNARKIYTEIIYAVAVPSFLGYAVYAQKRGYLPPFSGIIRVDLNDSLKIELVEV